MNKFFTIFAFIIAPIAAMIFFGDLDIYLNFRDENIAPQYRSVYRKADRSPGKKRKAMVFFHSLGTSPQAYSQLFDQFVVRGFDVVAIRLSGHFEANTPNAIDQVNYREWLTDAYMVLSRLHDNKDYDTVILGGHSTGGVIALKLFLQYRYQKAKGIFLVDPTLKFPHVNNLVVSMDKGIVVPTVSLDTRADLVRSKQSKAAVIEAQKLTSAFFGQNTGRCQRLSHYHKIDIPLLVVEVSSPKAPNHEIIDRSELNDLFAAANTQNKQMYAIADNQDFDHNDFANHEHPITQKLNQKIAGFFSSPPSASPSLPTWPIDADCGHNRPLAQSHKNGLLTRAHKLLVGR